MTFDGSPGLTLLDTEPGTAAFYGWHNTTIIVWTAQATGPVVERLAAATATVIARYPAGISNIHVIANGLAVPSPEARAGFVRMMQLYAEQLACVAVVFEGKGFWAAMLRSAITGLRMLAPRTFPMRFHESVDEVPLWLPQEHLKATGVALQARELARALHEARSFIESSRGLPLR